MAPERTNSCCFVNGFDRRQQCQLTRATGIDQKTLRRLESRPRGSIITTRELVSANAVRPLTSPWQAVPATPLSTSTSKRRRGRRCPCGIPIITLKHPPEQGRPLSLNCETSVCRLQRSHDPESPQVIPIRSLPLWCPGWGSNPHAFRGRRILSPLRLPIPPPGRLLEAGTYGRSKWCKRYSPGGAMRAPALRSR